MPRVLLDDRFALVVVFHLLVGTVLLLSSVSAVYPVGFFLVGRAADSWVFRFARERPSCPD